jgi:hypothetical protein
MPTIATTSLWVPLLLPVLVLVLMRARVIRRLQHSPMAPLLLWLQQVRVLQLQTAVVAA